MLEGIDVLVHSSIKIVKSKVIYIDPFQIKRNFNDADIIFITHEHFDHYSEEDIEKVKKDDTIIIIPKQMEKKITSFSKEKIIVVEPQKKYKVENIEFETVKEYNTNKKFHPKENEWVGYIIELQGIKYYITGDTDITEENKKVKCDVIFIPVGGTYTMDYKEAVELVKTIQPKIAVPIHYGSIVGKQEDAENFVKLLPETIQGVILMKE